MSTLVKYFVSSMSGVAQLSANPGSLVDVLDTCLVTGFGLQSVTNLVVTAGVATATVASNTLFTTRRVVLLAGNSTIALNGEFRITAYLGTTFSFPVPGVADGTYMGGTPTVKMAPLGFEILFTAANKRIYRSTSLLSNGVCLRVDDTNTASGWNMVKNVAGTYRAMARVDHSLLPVSVDSTTNGTGLGWWIKSNVSTGTSARSWMIVGDDRGFYINTLPNNGYVSGRLDYFGELSNVTRPNDKYANLLTGFDQANCGFSYDGSASYTAPGDITYSRCV